MGSDPTRQEIDALLEWCKAEAERFGPDCVIPVLFDLPSAVTSRYRGLLGNEASRISQDGRPAPLSSLRSFRARHDS